MSNFWSSLFGGANSSLSNDIGKTAQIGDFATSMGESNLTAGSNFDKAILSGDSSKQAQVLAPVISADKVSAQQNNKTASEFGTRSGGTAASTAATNDKVHGDITNLIGSLTGKSASDLTSSGGSLLNQGASAFGQNAQLSEEQMNNWQKSILGEGLGFGIGKAEGFGLNKLFNSGGSNQNQNNGNNSSPFSAGANSSSPQTTTPSINGYYDSNGNWVSS